MSLILHLSDLHLGGPSPDQSDFTDKFGLEPASGDTKIMHLGRTLRALGDALRAQDRILDAIVVSGDLTNGNQQDGYDAFEVLLSQLGDRRPTGNQILVVPGNHDADWKFQAGKPAKFRRFLDTTRSSYRTPLLYGLDYDDESLNRATGSRKKAAPLLEFDDVAIVAISSADFCGVEEQGTSTPWDEVLSDYLAAERASNDDAVSKPAVEAAKLAANDLRTLRVQDMARVHPQQIDALRERLKGSSLVHRANDDVRLRIAVLHHPIGPVTGREEVKAFESLTNLATVRSFLFDLGFQVVLHGHKHASYLGWEWLVPPSDRIDDVPWRALAIGSPGDFQPGRTVCRLLETCPVGERPVAGAPRLRVIEVRGVRSAETVTLDFDQATRSLAQPFVGSNDVESPWVVRAQTADAAYQQLRDLPATLDIPRPVISVVEDSASAARLPANYPEPRDDAWLESLVEWWQHPRPEAVRAVAGSKFNHGERLYGENDAIAKAALALPSSKAIALLVDATDAGTPDREYPALTAVQLQARRGDAGTLIDAVGIFRKQDLALWWPVNMAELRHIQETAISAADKNKKLKRPVMYGRLIAMTTLGIHDTVLPQMAGTTLDRSIDLDPNLSHRLAYLAAQPRDETQHEWQQALGDIGTVEDEVVVVPSIGVERLHGALTLQCELGEPQGAVRPLVAKVAELEAHSRTAATALADRRELDAETRDYWGDVLRSDVGQVLTAVKARVKAAGLTWVK